MAGSFYVVEVRPDASGWSARLTAQIDPVTRAIADNLRRQLQDAVRDGLSGAGINTRVQGTRTGTSYADAFSRAMKSRLEAAFRSLPKVQLDANSSDVDKTIAGIRRRLGALDRAIDLGIDQSELDEQLAKLRAKLRVLSHDADIKVRLNAGTALAELEALKRVANDDNKRGNIFTRLIDSARNASPVIDGVIGKLGSVGGAVSSVGGNNLVGTLALVAAIVAALSTIGPLAAAAAGGVLGIAGAAGVAALAVIGLKKQMAEQTGFGQQISEQFKGITREVGGLAQVAANAVGPAITDVLGLVRKVLPSFQGLVQLVGGRLGGAFREVGSALILAFQKSAPLVVQVVGYVEQGAAALRRWVASDSFTQFVLYASRELPVVIGFAKALGTAILGIFEALAPLGEALLRVLTPILNFIGKVGAGLGALLNRFLGIGGTADSSFGANSDLTKAFQALGQNAADAADQAAPLDNYKKIIGDLAPALQLAAGNGGQFQVAVTGITDRLRAAAPALQTFMDTAAAYDATSAKVGDTAKLLGDALNASRGNALDYAASIVGADVATQSFAKTLHDNIDSVAKDGTLLGVSHLDAAGKFVDASDKYSAGSQNIVQSFQAQVKAATDAATATYTNELATKGQATAANDALTIYKGYRQSLIDSSVAANTARDKAEALADQYFAIPPDVDTFVKLLGQNDVSLAIQGLTDALNRLSDFIGAPKVELNDTDFNNSLATANSQLDYFGQKTPTPSIYANTEPFGIKMGQSNRALDEFNGRGVYATVAINDQATGKLHEINSLIANLHDKTITINTRTGGQAVSNAYGGVYPHAYAAGGIVDGMAAKLAASAKRFAGGSEFHVPQIAMPNGGVRIWAEPETQGEAYIPFAMDRRARSEGILSEVAKRFGGAYLPGGAVAASASVGGGDPAVLERLSAIEAAVYAGASHTVSGYHEAVDKQASVVAQVAARGVRDPFSSGSR